MILKHQTSGSGQPLVLVHGFPLHAGMWRDQLSGLSDIAQVVAVDLRGHGHSPIGEEPFTMELFADDLAETIDSLKLGPVHLGALSMGGYVAFAFWRRYPDRVRSMILCDTKAEADGPDAQAARDATAKTVREEGIEAIWSGLGPKLLGKDPSEEVTETLRQIVLACDPEAAALDALAMKQRPDSTGTLPTISVPSLWIHGVDDQLMAPDAARASAKAMPDCEFVEIPDAGHMAPLENPEAANEAIRRHLKRA
ncbi:MAG: alpha/beta fold hydrolase [Actinomycetota bacterium]